MTRMPNQPPYRLRACAEWEPAVGVLIGWPLFLPDEIVVALAEREDLWVTLADPEQREVARAGLEALGLPPERIHIIETKLATWAYTTRDWGPAAVFDEWGHMRLADPRYVGYPISKAHGNGEIEWLREVRSPVDFTPNDVAPAVVAEALGLENVELPFAFTGGNAFVDGNGTALSTRIVLPENEALGLSEARLRALARQTLGIETWILVPDFEIRGGQHIDCLLKLLDEDRILLKRPPEDHPEHATVEAVASVLSEARNAAGRPYEVLRIDTPRFDGERLANYTNVLILNRRIFMPHYGIEADAAALATWRAAMPGYEVRGFLPNREMAWSHDDAIHCRTRAVWDSGMLWLRHTRPASVVEAAGPHRLEVTVRAYSGAALVGEELRMHWRPQGETHWREAALGPAGASDVFEATIPGQMHGTTLEYWFAAADASGRRETLPRTAPQASYAFSISAM